MSKKLYRSDKDKIIGGVCGGIAKYLDIDPVIVRVLFVIGLITEGFGLMVYILLWIIMPEEQSTAKETEDIVKENIKDIEENVVKATKGIQKEIKSDTKKK